MPSVCSEPEYLIVDDNSAPEHSVEVAQISRDYPGSRVVQLHENLGQHRATLLGLLMARGDVVITLDDDSPYELVLAVARSLTAMANRPASGSVFFVRTKQRSRNFGVAVLRGIAKGTIAFLASCPAYLSASSTRIIDDMLVRTIVAKSSDSEGSRTILSRPLSLDALVFSACSHKRFSEEVVTVAVGDTRYTLRGLVKHAVFVVVSMWHFRGGRAFVAPFLFACVCEWCFSGAGVGVALLMVLGFISSKLVCRKPKRCLSVGIT